MSRFAHSVRQLPGVAALAVLRLDVLFLWLFNQVVQTHVDERLLVKVLFVDVADQLLGDALNAEESIRLDQLSARRQITLLF